jgi:hypothetical protein
MSSFRHRQDEVSPGDFSLDVHSRDRLLFLPVVGRKLWMASMFLWFVDRVGPTAPTASTNGAGAGR